MKLLLASASPRRRALIAKLGMVWRTADVNIVETECGRGDTATLTNACSKAAAALPLLEEGEVAIGCDTVVSKDGRLYGKPVDETDARRMLGELCGAVHEVLTGMCVLDAYGNGICRVVRTKVWLRDVTTTEIDAYIATGEPFDKAGAYGIQGEAGAFVTRVEGDLENVIGMSTQVLDDMLRALQA